MMLALDDHPTRRHALSAWIVLVGRFCGVSAVAPFQQVERALSSVRMQHSFCPGAAGRGMFAGFTKYASERVKVERAWLSAMSKVGIVRNECIGYWCFDIDVCALHLKDCASFWEEGSPQIYH